LRCSLLSCWAIRLEHAPDDHRADRHHGECGNRRIVGYFGRRGLRGLVFNIENRALRPGANLYLVTRRPAGDRGNVGSLAPA